MKQKWKKKKHIGLTRGWLVLGSWLVVESGSRLAHETKKLGFQRPPHE